MDYIRFHASRLLFFCRYKKIKATQTKPKFCSVALLVGADLTVANWNLPVLPEPKDLATSILGLEALASVGALFVWISV